MSGPVIIACAITGTRPQKSDNPAVPISPDEQIESTHAAFEAGASLVHVHVRDDRGRQSSDRDRYARVLEGVRTHCPGMIVEFSTGGMGRPFGERAWGLELGPDMASLCTGSVNFPDGVYQNPPELIEELAATMAGLDIKPEIEIFDLGMLYAARDLVDTGILRDPLHVLFVLGLPCGLPARRQVLDFLVSELHDLAPEATWTASGLGRFQAPVMDWSLYLGGHLRTGLEDNIRITRDELVVSNAQLVERAANLCMSYGAHAASPAEARTILGLPQVS